MQSRELKAAETDTTVVLNDCTDNRRPEESSDDDLTALSVRDFLVVKFAGSTSLH